MTDDCHPWEMERGVWIVKWTCSSHTMSVVVDGGSKDRAIDRAWNWCKLDHRPRSKDDMKAEYNTILL